VEKGEQTSEERFCITCGFEFAKLLDVGMERVQVNFERLTLSG